MIFPLFIASGQQAVGDLVGWFMVLPLALILSLCSCWFALKRWKTAAVIFSILSLALTALLASDPPIWAGWFTAVFGVFGLGAGLLLKRPIKKEEEANQPPQTTTGSSAPDRV